MSDWGYAERGPLYASLTLAQWVDMLLGEDPDDRAIREAHGFGYQVPDFPDDAPCRNGCGAIYGYIMAGKVRACAAAPCA